MSRRNRERAAQEAASEAGRILQAQRQSPELNLEPAAEQQSEQSEGNNASIRRSSISDNPHFEAMAEIDARHARTSGTEEPPAEQEPEKVVEQPKQAEPPVIEPAAEKDAENVEKSTLEQEPAPVMVEMVRVKVDGQEFDVPKAEIDEAGGVKSYQMQKASENRLAKATQALAETRRAQDQMAQWIRQNTPQKPSLTDDQVIQSKVDIIRFGTPEESAAALREVMALNQQNVDPAAITQLAVSQIRKENAVDNFKKEFHDVVGNPMLLRLAISLENERGPQALQNQQTDWSDFYRKIGNEVRSVVGRVNQPSQPAAVVSVAADQTSPVDKEARKGSIVNLPTAAARAARPEESKPESREEILNEMRKARGIPTG